MARPKIDVDGVTREMNEAEYARYLKDVEKLPAPEPSPEERLAQQAQEIADLKEALELLLSGATEEATDNG